MDDFLVEVTKGSRSDPQLTDSEQHSSNVHHSRRDSFSSLGPCYQPDPYFLAEQRLLLAKLSSLFVLFPRWKGYYHHFSRITAARHRAHLSGYVATFSRSQVFTSCESGDGLSNGEYEQWFDKILRKMSTVLHHLDAGLSPNLSAHGPECSLGSANADKSSLTVDELRRIVDSFNADVPIGPAIPPPEPMQSTKRQGPRSMRKYVIEISGTDCNPWLNTRTALTVTKIDGMDDNVPGLEQESESWNEKGGDMARYGKKNQDQCLADLPLQRHDTSSWLAGRGFSCELGSESVSVLSPVRGQNIAETLSALAEQPKDKKAVKVQRAPSVEKLGPHCDDEFGDLDEYVDRLEPTFAADYGSANEIGNEAPVKQLPSTPSCDPMEEFGRSVSDASPGPFLCKEPLPAIEEAKDDELNLDITSDQGVPFMGRLGDAFANLVSTDDASIHKPARATAQSNGGPLARLQSMGLARENGNLDDIARVINGAAKDGPPLPERLETISRLPSRVLDVSEPAGEEYQPSLPQTSLEDQLIGADGQPLFGTQPQQSLAKLPSRVLSQPEDKSLDIDTLQPVYSYVVDAESDCNKKLREPLQFIESEDDDGIVYVSQLSRVPSRQLNDSSLTPTTDEERNLADSDIREPFVYASPGGVGATSLARLDSCQLPRKDESPAVSNPVQEVVNEAQTIRSQEDGQTNESVDPYDPAILGVEVSALLRAEKALGESAFNMDLLDYSGSQGIFWDPQERAYVALWASDTRVVRRLFPLCEHDGDEVIAKHSAVIFRQQIMERLPHFSQQLTNLVDRIEEVSQDLSFQSPAISSQQSIYQA
eukprot:GHVN01000759.1.p1 GENE.GHVN01000759.1~~GHVN01000759.1.p1  ORF type:complete len:822 (-),score=94.27 GHVN01000759.1:1170-3635(-)